jgi:hypothetical protein
VTGITTQVYPPLTISLECPLLIDGLTPFTVIAKIDNTSSAAFTAQVTLTSSGLKIANPKQNVTVAANSTTQIEWLIRKTIPEYHFPHRFTDIELFGVSNGFGLMSQGRQVCSVGQTLLAETGIPSLTTVQIAGMVFFVIGVVLWYPKIYTLMRSIPRQIYAYRFNWSHLIILVILGILVIACLTLIGPGYYVNLPNKTIPAFR